MAHLTRVPTARLLFGRPDSGSSSYFLGSPKAPPFFTMASSQALHPERILHTLRVRVSEGKNLKGMDRGGTSDPYVVVSGLGTGQEVLLYFFFILGWFLGIRGENSIAG